MYKKTRNLKNPRKWLVLPFTVLVWILVVPFYWFFEIFGRIADLLELIIGSPISSLLTWTENYDYDKWSKSHPQPKTTYYGYPGRYDYDERLYNEGKSL